MTQPRLSSPLPPSAARTLQPRARLTLWWALLAAYSLQDLGLTAVALSGIPEARELNPLADAAFEQGILLAFALKAVALAVVLGIALLLARTKHWPLAERHLAAWCIVLLTVNAHSAIHLLGGL